ncbi:glycosyltransferase [Empedobacter falsenii]|uniref:Glycosyltransferase n=1 Tax=Empedobacter falsenii TaxID=343874 RepID=A0ABY8VGA1_9FLAO|nr:glycosyltransferase family 2 protein [Empedobacter falsenii]WIH98575.1 glycosyltransferase [Empedobacter falsenii]
MSHPLITIIIPVYNVEAYIEKCLLSVQNQNFKDFEVILVNDGSTDKSQNKAQNFVNNDSRFQIINIKNQGVSNARNIGLSLAKGKYIAFIDSDDYVSENYLLDFVNDIPKSENFIIIQNAFDSIDYVISPKFNFIGAQFSPDKHMYQLFKNNSNIEFGYLWNKFFVNRIIQKYDIKFDYNKALFEDEEFYYDYLTHIDTIVTSAKSNYYYVSRNNSAIKKKWDINYYLMKFDLRNNLFQRFKQNGWINKNELDDLMTDYFNKYIYIIFKEHIYNLDDNNRVKNMKHLSPFLNKYGKYFESKINKRLFFVLSLIRLRKYRLASIFINNFLY